LKTICKLKNDPNKVCSLIKEILAVKKIYKPLIDRYFETSQDDLESMVLNYEVNYELDSSMI